MKTPACCSSLRFVRSSVGALLFGLLCGCGSGIGSSGFNPNTPSAPVANTAGPQLGYFWNPSDQSLRPILGIPGSSQVGQSVVPAGTYTAAGASSASGMAVLQESDGSLDVMSLPSGAPVHVAAVTNSGAQFRFSPSGKAALVFSPGSNAAVLVTKLTTTPVVANINSPSAIQDAALSEINSIAIAASGGSGTAIQVISANGIASTLATVGTLGGLSFVTADDLLYADAAANTLTLTRSASTAPSPTLVPTAGLLKTPAALGASSNGQWVLLANSAEPSAVRIDLTAQTAPLRIACSCTPTMVAAMSGSGTFRITAPGTGPLWGIDTSLTAPRSFFIPAVR